MSMVILIGVTDWCQKNDKGGFLVAKKSEIDFEKSLQQLEKIVDSLEAGELSLDQTMNKFEEGVNLYKQCKEQLSKAEKKIKVLIDNLNEEDI